MDLVRDLVAGGGVSVVLAQDRDRFSREPAYTYLLRREFEEHGCELRSLNDRGDGSPEGDLTDGILDQLAKYERAKIAERTRRGMMRKAREGRVVVTRPAYGFRYNEARDALVVCEPEMAVVEKVLRLAADGLGQNAIQTRLFREGVPSPTGKPEWDWSMIKKIVYNDAYRPHTFEETPRSWRRKWRRRSTRTKSMACSGTTARGSLSEPYPSRTATVDVVTGRHARSSGDLEKSG